MLLRQLVCCAEFSSGIKSRVRAQALTTLSLPRGNSAIGEYKAKASAKTNAITAVSLKQSKVVTGLVRRAEFDRRVGAAGVYAGGAYESARALFDRGGQASAGSLVA